MAITKIELPELFDFGSDNLSFKLPTGTTLQRPQSPSNGEMRFNTTTGYVEYYDTTDAQWWEIEYFSDLLDVEYLVVAGGGTGGNRMSGGGGGGGVVHNFGGTPLSLTASTNYTVTVGAEAIGTNASIRINGNNSVFDSITAIGGGGASGFYMPAAIADGADGGSGGGTGAQGGDVGGAALQPSSASGGFGNVGGSKNVTGNDNPGGGGGGAGTAGQTITSSGSSGGTGGNGLQVNIDGNNYYWAGGGGGSSFFPAGAGGIGGGGGGGSAYGTSGAGGGSAINSGSSGGSVNTSGGNAGSNTGGGGGGAPNGSASTGGNGGSGIVILRYPGTKVINVGSGLTASTATVGTDSVTTFTAGTGTIDFS